MFYKKENNGDWLIGKVIKIGTSGEILDENNKENEYGWEWHDTPPQEYLDWLEEQEIEEEIEM